MSSDPIVEALKAQEQALLIQLKSNPIYMRLEHTRNTLKGYVAGFETPQPAVAAPTSSPAAPRPRGRPPGSPNKQPLGGKRRGRKPNPAKVAAIVEGADRLLHTAGAPLTASEIASALKASGIETWPDKPAERVGELLKESERFDFAHGRFRLKQMPSQEHTGVAQTVTAPPSYEQTHEQMIA